MAAVQKVGTYTGHRDCVYVLEKASKPSHFFSAAGDGMVVLWDFLKPDQGELVSQLENSVYAMTYDQKRNYLIIGQNFKGFHVIDLDQKKEIRYIQFTDQAIFELRISKGNIWAACGDGKVYIFDAKDFQLQQVLHHSDKSARCMAVHPLHGHVAVGYSDHFIRVFNSDGSFMAEWQAHSNSVFGLAYSPNSLELLSGGRDAHLKIWNTNDYSLKEKIVAHMYAINHIVFSPDGSRYATASMDKSIKVWDAEKHKLLKVIDKSRHAGHGTSVNKLLWTHYEHWLVSASDDRSISVWNIES